MDANPVSAVTAARSALAGARAASSDLDDHEADTRELAHLRELADAFETLDRWLLIGADDEQIIRIIFTDEDVRGMAEESGVEPDVALDRAREWGKHIADTAMGLCSEQLESCINTGTP